MPPEVQNTSMQITPTHLFSILTATNTQKSSWREELKEIHVLVRVSLASEKVTSMPRPDSIGGSEEA
jgi:hypothetical protein